MANQFLTLKDITALDHLTDPASVGLVNTIVNVAPELKVILGRPITGISYDATILTAAGSNGGFRRANSGVAVSAPSLDVKRFNCFAWDVQNSVDEAVLVERQSSGETPATVFGTIAKANAIQEFIKLGRQFYGGSLVDPLGCPGMVDFLYTQRTQLDSRTGLKIDQVIDAGGTGSNCETAWFINVGSQGVHWLWGLGRGIVMNPWMPQYGASPDSTAANPLRQRQWNSNMFGFIGTSMANPHSIGAIINIDNTIKADGTYTAPLTDKLIAALYAKFPIETLTDANVCMASKNSVAGLQSTRPVTNFADNGTGNRGGSASTIAAFPSNLPTFNNIPIIPTDSITAGARYIVN
jgi:hypothetical protein